MLKHSTTRRILRLASSSCCLNSTHYSTSAALFAAAPSVAFKKPKQSKPDWNRAISEAERIVGYPTSFLSLRWLLSDEIANVAIHLRRLVGSSHPFLKTAKNMLYSSKSNMQAWGLVVLLVSKSVGYHSGAADMDKTAGVLHSQRALAEVTQMISTAHLIHKSLVNLQCTGQTEDDLVFGNKIALLSGDYLLGNCCAELATLREQSVVELISSALRDQSEAELIGRRDLHNNPLPSPPLKSIKRTSDSATSQLSQLDENNLGPLPGVEHCTVEEEWSLRHILSPASLLGKACQGALFLGGHNSHVQNQGYLFGKHLALAWQASIDMEPFIGEELDVKSGSQPFSLVSAPVLFSLETDPTLYDEIETGAKSIMDINFVNVWKRVKQGSGVEMARSLQVKHADTALDILESFPNSEARTALANIISSIQTT